MSRFTEISSLFAALASNLQLQDSMARNELDLSISDLNSSLNLSEDTEVHILDTALSLMCFTAPQVYDSITEFTLKTIFTVLSASVECKVLRSNNEQVLRVGGTISRSDCAHVMDDCAFVLGKLYRHKGDLCSSISYAAIRMSALAPCSRKATKSSGSRISPVASLLSHCPNEFKFRNDEVPIRLLLWHLDPMILKQDIMQILQEIIKRPFLSFSMEVYNRTEWKSKLICLVMSPSMFTETRALLHNWFLMTGSASVMELLIDLVQQVLDVNSRPMWWGLSMEVGSKLPFSYSYFPHDHHIFRILAGPISQEYFQLLLSKLSLSVSHGGDHLHASSKKSAMPKNLVDHKSAWALVMSFPCWFIFASMSLYCSNGPTNSSMPWSVKSYLIHDTDVSCSTGAAKFIAWILNPISESYQDLMVEYLVKVSAQWTLKWSSSSKCNKVPRPRMYDTDKPKLQDKDETSSHDKNNRMILCWLREFTDIYATHFKPRVGISASNSKEFHGINESQLLRRIPLGILLVYPYHVTTAECSLVLHYAATGDVNSGQSQKGWRYEQQYTKAEAIAGCKTVFDITNVAESICPMFETEEEGIEFVCQLKIKACDYLVGSVKRLIEIKQGGDGIQMQKDLLSRVIRWRHQGKDVFQNNKDLDYICSTLPVN